MTRILVTGASGSIGTALCERLAAFDVIPTDKDTLDVTTDIADTVVALAPSIIYHLAGAKSAPAAEDDPATAIMVNAVGTMNMVEAANLCGARFVLASTCKAADPETAYGASKLLAEKVVLAAGGTICRFYNVRETCGNVFELWRGIPEPDPIPFTDCCRFFISSDQAVDLLIAAAALPSGRYTVDPGPIQDMQDVARRLYPARDLVRIPPRRGDRFIEPLCADNEHITRYEGVLKITSEHDPVRESACA